MGLSTVMASTIIFYMLITMIGFLAGITVMMLSSTVKAQLIVDELPHDDINLENYTYNSTTAQIEINITNTGSNIIYRYEDFDIIVKYTNNTNPNIFYASFQGAYTNTTTPGWYIKAVYDASGYPQPYNNTAPVLWKPNTTLEILIILPSTPDPDTKVSITIATPGGGKEYLEFTG